MTFAAVSFLAGVLTVLSPCVLPLLPVIVGGSVAGERSWRRAATVVAALGISVFAFTFLLKVSTAFVAVPESVWEWLSGGILFLVGIFFVFPNLYDLLPGAARGNAGATRLMSRGFMRQSFWGDIVVGAALGPVFTTCSPTYFVVLATVLPVSLAAGVGDIAAYTLGLCLFLLLISILGQRALERLGVAADPRGWLRRAIGALFLLIAAMIVTGTLARAEAPLYSIFDETKIEERLLPAAAPAPLASSTPAGEGSGVASTANASSTGDVAAIIAAKTAKYPKAPELVSPDAYLNTGGKPITLASLRGKVVLVDFWTYSCINCQRTLPYLAAWYAKYKDQGLVVLGVHTPEFAFEHLESNVAAALKQFGITYPVVLDNEDQTWAAYGNQFWPHEYLIDEDGFIVHDHIGEGGYSETEAAIQAALAERAARAGQAASLSPAAAAGIPEADLSGIGSPETYFGAARNEFLGNGAQGQEGPQTLAIPAAVAPNTLYLGGAWDFAKEYATAAPGATVVYEYQATKIYLVASGAAAGTPVEVWQDGARVKTITVSASKLYTLVENASAGTHTLKLIVKGAGLAAYTLDFG
ncbi:MAG: redoxin domain-containing protein [Patescibacteria group bacterium]|nr:redoxin domain-containing protein [Patescibacteria group bacterium]MDE2057792.1 redoxin domain-containing protein [Patescibacteria group bacterium]